MNDGTPLDPKAPVIVNNVLYNADAIVATWMNERAGFDMTTVTFRAFGLIDPDSASDRISDRILAGVYFFDHHDHDQKHDIQMAAVIGTAEMHKHRAAIRQMLTYPFGQLKMRRITAEIDESNVDCLKAADVLGFQVEGRKPFAGKNGGSFLVLGLYPDACPFWKDAA